MLLSSVCDAVHYGAQGRCRGLKVVPCSWHGIPIGVTENAGLENGGPTKIIGVEKENARLENDGLTNRAGKCRTGIRRTEEQGWKIFQPCSSVRQILVRHFPVLLFQRPLHIHFIRHICCKMYCSATTHSEKPKRRIFRVQNSYIVNVVS